MSVSRPWWIASLLAGACSSSGSSGQGPEADIDAASSESPDAGAAGPCRFGPLTTRSEEPLTRAGGEPINPSGIMSDPWVMRDGDRWRMWFTSVELIGDQGRLQTAVGESDDGVAWNGLVDPVLGPSEGSWDRDGVETVSVVRTDGGYRLYYTGDVGSHGVIGMATSPDGVTWTKRAAPVLEPLHVWEQPVCDGPPGCPDPFGGVLEPSVIVEEDGYRMWYAAMGTLDEIPTFRIGHARSADGVSWTREERPVFQPGRSGSWDELIVSHVNVIPDPAGGYHMFYAGISIADDRACSDLGGCAFTPARIGHAVSADGLTWTADPEPLLAPRAGRFDAWTVGGPSAAIHDGTLYLWYFGSAAGDTFETGFGLATASCREE